MMDYMEMMQDFDKVLMRAPVNCSHWNIKTGVFVSMGDAVVEGYLNLAILRRVKSLGMVGKMTKPELLKILNNAPEYANSYSLESKKYFNCCNKAGCYEVQDKKHKPITLSSDLKQLVFIEHIQSKVKDFGCQQIDHLIAS